MTTPLKPKYTSNKSYYNKAHIITSDNSPVIQLKSYNTIVLEYNTDTQQLTKLWNGYSRTTQKHIIDFVRQYTTLNVTPNKKWWDSLPAPTTTKYKVVANHIFGSTYNPTTTFDNYESAEEYADKLNDNSRGLWYYSVKEI